MENHKLKDKQKTLNIDNNVKNIQKDEICIENPVELKSNLHELQDNRSIDLMGE